MKGAKRKRAPQTGKEKEKRGEGAACATALEQARRQPEECVGLVW
ncbi:MAG TPA: hypothetical protein VI382_10135 [Candidatus Manganitrophaceae bacterium]|nr:hypothetical protein [Candidatus Manganitrophaceae bacterium]